MCGNYRRRAGLISCSFLSNISMLWLVYGRVCVTLETERKTAQKELKNKKIRGITLLIVLSVVFTLIVFREVDEISFRYDMESRIMGMESVSDSIDEELWLGETIGNDLYDYKASLRGIEETFNSKLLVFAEAPDGSGHHRVMYSSEDLPEYQTAEEYGIDENMLANARTIEEMDAETLARDSDGIVVGITPYIVILQKKTDSAVGESLIYAYFIPVVKMGLMMSEQTIVISLVFLMIAIMLFVWIYSTYKLIYEHSLNEEQREALGIRKMIRRLLNGVAVGGIVILFVTVLFMSLSRLFTIYHQVDDSFSTLSRRLSESRIQSEHLIDLSKKTCENYAAEIAAELTVSPQKATAAYLQGKCDDFGAEYIMLFDENGNETVSNSGYVGISLGTDPASSTYDFRRLLNGVPSITHGLMTDELTGFSGVMIGVRMGEPEATGHYGALLMAVPEDMIYIDTDMDAGYIMSSIVYDGMEAFSVDPDSRMILASSDPSLAGKSVTALGLEEKALNSGYRDSFEFNGKHYYGECAEMDGVLYYYAAEESEIGKHIIGYALGTVATYFMMIMVLVLYMMHGYGSFFEYWSGIGEELKSVNTIRDESGRDKISIDPSVRWRTNTSDYGVLAPIHEAYHALNISLVVCLLGLGLLYLTDTSDVISPMISYVLRGTWSKGWNLFSFTNILILGSEIFVIATVLNFIITLSINILGTKGATIGRLLLSLVKYASVIFFIYLMLLNLGFNPNALLASLGLISFAVSLGAQDLIKDIMAGLSSVFEGEYQVGDIIEVGGFRGKVLEIGVRTTKLEGRGGNILILSNSRVSNIVNMTRMNSWYPLELRVASDDSFTEVEELLRKELPGIGESIPEIITGPFYKGITGMSGNILTISIIAECNEADYHQVQRSLNSAIREMLDRNGVKLM